MSTPARAQLSPKSYSDTSSSSHRSSNGNGGTTTTSKPSKDRLRAAADALRDRGVRDVDEALRFGAAVMAERCIDAFDAGDFRPGWLFEAVKQGGAWFGTEPRGEYQQLRAERSTALRERFAELGIQL